MFQNINYNTTFHTIQNSYKGAIMLQFSNTGALLQFTQVFKPISPKDIKSGMKIYNYEGSIFFKLDVSEVMTLIGILDVLIANGGNPEILQGAGKMGGFDLSRGISLTHYPQNGTSMFSMFVADKGGWQIGLTNKNNQTGQDFKLYLDMGPGGLTMFRLFLQQSLTFITSYNATQKALWDATRPPKNKNNYNNNYQNSNSGGNYQNNYQQNNRSNYQQNNGGQNNYQNNATQNNYQNNAPQQEAPQSSYQNNQQSAPTGGGSAPQQHQQGSQPASTGYTQSGSSVEALLS